MTDDLPRELKTLFERARADEDPSNADRSAVHRALAARLGLSAAAGAGAALSAGSAAAQGTASSAAGIMTASAIVGKTGMAGVAALWLAIGATVGTGVSLATVFSPASPPQPTVPAAPADPHGTPALESRNSPPLRPAPPTIQSTTRIAEPEAEKPRPPSSKPKTAETATPENEPRRVSAPALREEAHALAAVQQALRDEQPQNALELLDAQEQSFPNGALRAERAAARVLALCAGHRIVAARAAAAEFLRNYPDSPIANRVRGSCAK